MEEENMYYPLHLGVTEAGGGEDGRIKSALGIGTLLEDGIGDTIRVSLTEDPIFEVPVALSLVNRYKKRGNHQDIKPLETIPYNPYEYNKRQTFEISGIGGNNVVRVIADFSRRKIIPVDAFSDIGYFYNSTTDKWNMNDSAADIIFLGDNILNFDLPAGLKPVFNYLSWKKVKGKSFPLFTAKEYLNSVEFSSGINFIKIGIADLDDVLLQKLKNEKSTVIVLETENLHAMPEQRRVFCELLFREITNPVIIKRTYFNISQEDFILFSSTDFGALLIEGFGDGVWAECYFIEKDKPNNVYVKSFIQKNETSEKTINKILFGILQAARTRISKTEYIACPSCGRTLFDLEEHLKGVKIAIMGCIVNGPGEMADADYGYVGSGIDKITLYKGKEIVRRNIPAMNAVECLIEIIRENNDWQEPNL
jgi:(E)-4-hydroxy-3-methylbut-2-enyl-diphosphate synthase